MKANVHDPDCPARTMLDRIGDKWTVLVVLTLLDGPRRFNDLRARIGKVAPKVLTETLRRLERDGVLTRTAYAEIPPRVVYELTPLGRSLERPIRSIADWAEQNIESITAARDAYDGSASDGRIPAVAAASKAA
jgi:DNA-binding HxlR family transcriptional regulator